MVKYEDILLEGDIILEGGSFYRVIFIDESKSTIDLKCYNRPLVYKCVPFSNLYDSEIQILKEIPKNVTFLYG